MVFSLAYSTLFWEHPDLEPMLIDLKAAGWNGWEGRQALDWLGSASRVRRICDAVGLEMAAVGGPNATLSVDDPTHQINKRRIEFAADMGVGLYMVKGPGRQGTLTTDADLGRMAIVYDDLSRFAMRLGVTVVFHPHVGHLVNSENDWRRFMDRLTHCRLCMDMSHAVHWGMDPVQVVHDFAERIAYVHLHDFKGEENVELGQGQMCDFSSFLSALETIGYEGWITGCPGQTSIDEQTRMQVNRSYLASLGY